MKIEEINTMIKGHTILTEKYWSKTRIIMANYYGSSTRCTLILVLSALSVVTILLDIISSPARADALGIAYWPRGISVNIGGQNIGLPGGQLSHGINGRGINIR
jgi:hypothetical protein